MRSWTLHAGLTRLGVVALLAAAVQVPWAAAQDVPDEAEDREATTPELRDESEKAKPTEGGRPPWASRRGKFDRNQAQDDLRRMVKLRELMDERITLREEQVEPVGALFDEHIQAIRDKARGAEEAGGKNADRIRELEEQLDQARRDRDRESMQKVFRELRELRGSAGSLRAPHSRFRAAVVEVLDEDQARTFTTLFREVMMPSTRTAAVMRSVQTLRQALRSLDLDPEQSKATRRHLAGLRRALSLADRGGDETADEIVAEIRQAVIGELTEEQVRRLEAAEAEVRERIEKRRRPRAQRRPGQRASEEAQEAQEAQRGVEDQAEQQAAELDEERSQEPEPATDEQEADQEPESDEPEEG